MNKIVIKIKDLSEKLHLIVYQLIIVFVILFYVVLKGATGHKFVVTNEEKIYFTLLLLTFVLSIFYKVREKFGKKISKIILWMLIIFAILTFGMAIYFFYFSITFDYEFWENAIIITSIFFILPIIFIWCNLYLIRKIINELKK